MKWRRLKVGVFYDIIKDKMLLAVYITEAKCTLHVWDATIWTLNVKVFMGIYCHEQMESLFMI